MSALKDTDRATRRTTKAAGYHRASALCHLSRRGKRRWQDHHHRQIGESVQKRRKGVMLAAGDTFRAAAVEQLQAWERSTRCTRDRPAHRRR